MSSKFKVKDKKKVGDGLKCKIGPNSLKITVWFELNKFLFGKNKRKNDLHFMLCSGGNETGPNYKLFFFSQFFEQNNVVLLLLLTKLRHLTPSGLLLHLLPSTQPHPFL